MHSLPSNSTQSFINFPLLHPPLSPLMSTFTPPSLPISISPATAGVGLGYGIAIAVGLLVLISTILLASYLCVKSKSTLSSYNPSLPPPIHQTDVTSHQHFIVGLDAQTIDAFYPKFVYKEEEENGKDDLSGPCPICLGDYEERDVLRRGPDCGHCFHVKCVDEWLTLSATCPLCRSSPVPSPIATPIATPLAELIPLARTRGR